MVERIRKPALAPPPIRPAVPRADDPTAFLQAHYQRIWEERMRDLPFVNPALQVAAVGFRRFEGDWLGVVVTPWFVNLMLISGGGQLWGDIPAGERRYLNLPCGTLQFLADDDPDIGPYQYCPLIAPVTALPDMVAALTVARDALATVFAPPREAAAEASTASAVSAEGQSSSASITQAPAPSTPPQPVSRRDFFRRLARK